MKSKLLASLIALCGLTSFAVNPVVVWNGDFDEAKSGASLTTNGNTVAGDGSNITISSSATGGVLFNLNPVLTTGKTTIIVKYSGLSTPSSDAVLLSAAVNGQVKDLVGVAIKSNGSYSNIWDNNADSRGSVDGDVTVPASGVIAFTYDGNNGTASNKGGAFYVKNDSSMSRKSQSLGSLYSSGNPINGFAVGGKRSSGSLGCVPNLVIEGVAIFDSVLSANDMAAYTFPEPAPKVEPLILVNFRNGDTSKGVQTSAVEGWTDETRHGEAAIPVGGTLSVNGISFATSGGGGRLWSNNWATPTADYASGTYKDVFGDVHESLIEEIKTSLCSPDLVLDSNVYKTGFLNGGGNGQSATISGLTVGQKYLVYVGFGLKKGDSDNADQTHTFKLEASGYTTAKSLQYVKVGASGDATTYTDYTVGNILTASVNGLMVVRLNGITPNSSGNIAFTMPSGRSGLNFLAVAKVNESKPTSKSFDISGAVSYDNLATEGLTSVTLNLTADATVTFTKAVSANLTFTGAYNLTVKGGQHLTWANITDSGVTGTRTYEISGSYTAADGLKNKIKADTTKATYVFKGTDNNGATLDFGTRAITSAIASHLVFEGGTGHSLTIGVNNGNTQLASGNTADTPFILVKGGTMLTVTTNWMTGYGLAFSSNSCIVRVNDGGTLKFNQGTTRVWYNGQLYLDPGATIDLSACGATSPDALGFNGGVLDAKQQIYVPATADGAEIGVVKITGRSLGLASDGTAGCGIFVGKNSRLEIEGFSNDSDKPAVSKYGEGELRISGNVAICNNTSKNFTIKAGLVTFNGTVSNSPVSVESGASISGCGTISSTLTLQAGSSIVVDPNSRLTASSSLTLANPINLICTPQQGLTVIVPPSGFAGTGYKVTLNGSEQQYDLYLESGALKLKFKTPPSFTEDLGAITAVVANGKGGTVEVDISNLQKADYADSLAYTLKFGDVIVGNPEESDGKLIFTLDPSTFKDNTVYRGEFILNYGDGEIKSPITVYEGEKTFVMMDEAIVIKEATTINDAAGCTITPVYANADYIDTCDSIYMVTLSATEAVDADADTELANNEQGGLRLVKSGDNTNVKLEYLYRDEDDNMLKWGDQWPKGTDLQTVTLALNESITVRVEFHYSKGVDADDVSYVKYSIGEDCATSVTSWSEKLKVTEVFISDGTVLPNNLTGLFQLDSAVVVDVQVELEPGHDDHVLDAAKTKDEAEALAAKIGIKVGETVAEKLNAAQQEAYKGYFRVIAKQVGNHFRAEVVFTEETEESLKNEIEKAVSAINTGSAEIAAKPGLYYGVKRGDTLDAMNTVETEMATSDKVTIKITKPEGASAHFYRIIVSPTPETK